MSSFSFKKLVNITLLATIATIVSAPYALAAEGDGTFDLTPFDPQARALPAQSTVNAPAYDDEAGYYDNGQPGTMAASGEQTAPTGNLNYTPSPSRRTGTQAALLNLAETSRTILSQRSQRLPRTTLDSFVYQAGGAAEQIYGDEGVGGLPPIFGFNEGHTIGSGISSGGLTTGHQSNMPSAWCSYY